MKRLLLLCLVFCMALGCFGCADGMSPVEHALIAIQAMDVDTFSSYMSSDSDTLFSRMRKTYQEDIHEQKRDTLRSLYGLLRYTMGEEAAVSNGVKTIAVTVTLPDMTRVRTLAEKRILVSAETAESVVREMLDSGEIEKGYMIEAVWQVKLVEEDGEWRIAYSDKANDAFVSDLYLSEMLTFFAQH